MAPETPRLMLLRPTLADALRCSRSWGDSTSMQYTHVDASIRDCRRRVAAHERRRRQKGYAPWTVLSKANGRIVGWGGLYTDPFDPGRSAGALATDFLIRPLIVMCAKTTGGSLHKARLACS
jgi:hypothetical protein